MADYFRQWLSMTERTDRSKLPKVFFVNWFRTNDDGEWLWPGFGDNSRVLKWICERVESSGKAEKTPIGLVPTRDALDLSGLDLPAGNLDTLLAIDVEGWKKEADGIGEFYRTLGGVPTPLQAQLDELRERLGR
jgi:phosphoenolpyruvate carboxykinase (GTP)